MIKLGLSHFSFRNELGMSTDGIAFVAATTEKNGFPEGIHFGSEAPS